MLHNRLAHETVYSDSLQCCLLCPFGHPINYWWHLINGAATAFPWKVPIIPHPSPIYSHMYRISKDILDLIRIEDHTQVQRQSGKMCGRKVWSTVNGFCSFITVSLQLITIPIGKVEFESYTNRLAMGPYYHTVGDTRIISMDPISLTLCSNVTLTVPRDESVVNATLYALSTPPNLNGRNQLNHTLSIHNKDDYDYYYLHPGSNVTISACTHTTPYAFDIIRGRPNFELWKVGKEEECLNPLKSIRMPIAVVHPIAMSSTM